MDNQDEELLAELRRNTAAIRALARFTLIEATAVVVSAFLIALGVLTGQNGAGIGALLLLIGAVVLIAGTVFSVSAGWSEFHASDRVEPNTDSHKRREAAIADLGRPTTESERFWCPRCRDYYFVGVSLDCPACGRVGHPAP